MRYFVQPATRWSCARYCLLARDGRTVIRVQASRPDGVEIMPPRHVAWARPAEHALLAPAPRRLHAAGGVDIARRRAVRDCPGCGRTLPREQFLGSGPLGNAHKRCIACRDGGVA